MLINGQSYTLPDGTPVVLRVPLIGSARLESQDGTPLFIRDGAHGWKALRPMQMSDHFAAAPCDLVDADLRDAA